MAQWWERIGRVAATTGGFAGAGFGAGTIAGGIGAIPGAIIGAGTGLVTGLIADDALNSSEAAQESQNQHNKKLEQIAEQQQGWLQEDRASRDSILRRLGTQANPYADGNPGLTSQMSLQQGAVDRNFANTTEDARRSLAMRGALGTPQETSLLRRIGVDRALAKSGAEAGLRANAYDKAQAFEQQRVGNQLGTLGMFQGSTGAGIYQNLSAMQGDRARDHQDQANQAYRAGGQVIGGLAQIGALGNDSTRRKPAETGTKQDYGYWGLG